jgi:hypothetical protein
LRRDEQEVDFDGQAVLSNSTWRVARSWDVNFQVTVLKILVSYPGGFAPMTDLKRDMAILATAGATGPTAPSA